ncbi:lytic transglycosylase domain-containing protein [Candidatus Weimeria sp. HCP3S3_B5]|uniref:lytic transglycosylase domain-containing protein n=1 Tax=Candidatus Weimeria sp. HCP3S3_B5 TaxID=3438871 RepID=UPI003F8C3B6D
MIVRISAGDYRFIGKISPENGAGSISQALSVRDNRKSVASFQDHLKHEMGMVYDKISSGTLQDDRLSAGQASDTAASADDVSSDTGFNVPSSLKPIFKAASDRYCVSEKLLEAVAYHESRFKTHVTSSSGAMGLMQLMPSTAKSLGVTDGYDPTQNIMGGAKLISGLLKEFNGDLDLAMAAYSNGSGAVHRAGNKVPDIRQAREFVSYIKSVMGTDNGK